MKHICLAVAENPRSPVAWYTGVVSDRDIYVDFLYNTSVSPALIKPGDTRSTMMTATDKR